GPDATRTGDYNPPVSADFTAPDFAAMAAALRAHDPEALVLPYCMTGGTDAKAFAKLGIPGFGFVPGRTPAGFDPWQYVHGSDAERAADLTHALNDPQYAGVFLACGGYGAQRTLELMDWERVDSAAPKVVVGYSDVTALLEAIAVKLGWVSLFGPMVACSGF